MKFSTIIEAIDRWGVTEPERVAYRTANEAVHYGKINTTYQFFPFFF
ncbi:hypothetical protein K4E_25850 [Enterococcus thailandicus]|nr:hypothetical protein K4E_25850 [Enterococcus thailandicus]